MPGSFAIGNKPPFGARFSLDDEVSSLGERAVWGIADTPQCDEPVRKGAMTVVIINNSRLK
jgi:hypothetical protein